MIRAGLGIGIVVVLLIAAGAIVAFVFGHDFAVGSAGIWAFLWLVVGTGLVIVGVGQTVIRRRKNRGRN
jgi:hypothetical protein